LAIARNRELTAMTLIDIVSKMGCYIILWAVRWQ